jgi:hypothetical protein
MTDFLTMPEGVDLHVKNEMPNVRVVEYGKNKVFIKREDPFGFWKINYAAGQTPKHLKGQYTEFDMALRDILRHLKNRGIEVTTIIR